MKQSIRISWPFIALGITALIFLSMGTILYVNNRPVHFKMPAHKMPKDNAWDDFMRAANAMLRPNMHLSPVSVSKPVSSYTDEDYRLFLKDLTPAMNVVRRALGKPMMMPVHNIFTVENYAGCRELCRSFVGESMYYKRIRQYDKAMESRLDGIEMGIMLTRGGTLIDDLVSSACVGICEIDSYLLIPKLSISELNSVALRMEKISEKRAPYCDIMIEEGNYNAKLWQDIINEPSMRAISTNPLKWIKNPPPFNTSGKVGAKEFISNVKWAFSNKSKMVYSVLDYFKDQAEHAHRPYSGLPHMNVPQDELGQLLYPNIDLGRIAHEKTRARFLLVQTHIDLYRYRADFGKFPARLEDLCPKYMRTLPQDPFGRSKPFRYKLLPGGKKFLVYSVGPDMRDDGGKPVSWSSASRKGDIRLEYR